MRKFYRELLDRIVLHSGDLARSNTTATSFQVPVHEAQNLQLKLPQVIATTKQIRSFSQGQASSRAKEHRSHKQLNHEWAFAWRKHLNKEQGKSYSGLIIRRKCHIYTSARSSSPAPLIPAVAGYTFFKLWMSKPLGVLLKSLSARNIAGAARAVKMIRSTWSYQYARKLLIGILVLAVAGLLSIFAACGFDQAHSVAVIKSIPRTLESAGWCLQTAAIYKFSLLGHSDRESPEYEEALRRAHESCAASLHNLCSGNGGIYVKAAQFLAGMQTIPKEYREQLEKLQDQAEPQDFEDIREAIERELGKPMNSIFASFEEEAKAAASLAQVHKARLLDGTEVAVKVQYLGLESAVAADLSTLSVLADWAALIFPDTFDFGWVVDRLGANLQTELDFRFEAKNAARFAECMANNPNVAVPQPVPKFSGRRVLTMEWVDGVKLNDKQGLVKLDLKPREVALHLLNAFGQMIFLHGYIHGDPHGGNILVRQQTSMSSWLWRWFGIGWAQPQIVFLDHGLYIDLSEQLRSEYCALWCSFLANDSETAKLVSTQIAGEKGGQILPTLLKPGMLSSEEQKRRFREEAGISGFGDIARLIEGLPEDFVNLLRVTGVVRPAVSKLGGTNTDRLRINAGYAYEGLWQGSEPIPGRLNSCYRRATMSIALSSLQFTYWLSCAVQNMFDRITYLPTKLGHAMYADRYV